jgi:hypothetical protein
MDGVEKVGESLKQSLMDYIVRLAVEALKQGRSPASDVAEMVLTRDREIIFQIRSLLLKKMDEVSSEITSQLPNPSIWKKGCWHRMDEVLKKIEEVESRYVG